MNNLYLFQDKTIGFYEHKIDLLRNGYIYASIEYAAIDRIVIKKGLIKNWIILLTLGLGFILAAGLIIFNVYANSQSSDFIPNLLTFGRGSKGFGIIAVLFLIAFGLYSVITSLKPTIKIIFQTNDSSRQFEISKIYMDDKLDSLYDFLRDLVPNILRQDI